jgi:hypothetical protein
MNLLDQVLRLEKFKHFKKIAEDDWRDPSVENAPFSISSKGWCDHVTGEKGTLGSLLKKQVDVHYIYDQSTCEKTDIEIITHYYDTRKIDITEKLIERLGMRVNRYRDNMSIITPMRSVDGKLIQLHIIDLDQNYRKIGKSRLLGKDKSNRGILIRYLCKDLIVVEGLEDGIILSNILKKNVVVSGPAVNFKRVKPFTEKYRKTTVILDNDKNKTSMIQSYHLGNNVKRLMPKIQGMDANDAVKESKFNHWYLGMLPVSFEEVENSRKNHNENGDVIDELNEHHSVIKIQGKVLVLNDEYDPMFKRNEISFSSKADLFAWYANKYITLEDENGEPKRMNKAQFWWSSPRRDEYRGFKLDPVNNTDDGFFNLWRGWAYESNEGDCSLYYKHLYDNIAQKDEVIYNYILDWMADVVQNPTKLPGVALVLRGGSGVGKGVAISSFCKLFGVGRHALQISNAEQVVGKFNGHLKDCIVLHGDEAFYAGDRQHEAVLKALVTEKVRMVELKRKDAFQFPNYTHIIMSSNKDWVVPMELDDRRFFVTDVSTDHQQDHQYFDAITKQMEDGGYEALLYDLQNRDLSNVNVRKYPMTSAILDNKLNSMDTVDQWIYERLKEKPFEAQEQIELLYQDYKNSCGRAWVVTKNKWSRHMRKVFWKNDGMRRLQKAGETGRYYEFRDVDICRRIFAKRFNSEVNWG